ncbi:MAG: ribonuclease III [Gammaproteobacteria bacterium]
MPEQADPIVELGKRLGYRFAESGTAEQALTHRSAGPVHNERLEFLGDAAIGLAVADMLYTEWPDLAEGDLTRMRSSLVNSEALARLARTLDLGELIMMGVGEQHGGGFQRRSTLEDVFEAVIGAVFVDGGYDAAREVLGRLFAEPLNDLPDPELLKDPKTRLQEVLQARSIALPEYCLTASSGPDHAREFSAECRIEAMHLTGCGRGSSRRRAEQAAADDVLSRLADLNPSHSRSA